MRTTRIGHAGRLLPIWLLSVGLVLASCGTAEDQPDDDAGDEEVDEEGGDDAEGSDDMSGEPVPVNVIYNADSVAIPEFTTYLAWEQLAEDGVIDVDYTFVGDAALGIQSLLAGDADWAHASAPVYLPANAESGDAAAFLAWKRQAWTIVGSPEIAEIEQIQGNNLGVHAEQSFTNTVAQLIIEEEGLEDVEVLFIEGSEVRAQALMSGELDSTVLDISDIITLQAQGVGTDLNLILSLGEVFPNQTNGRWALRNAWVEENRDTAIAIAQEMIRQNMRAYENTDEVVDLAVEYFDDQDPEVVEAIVRAYVENEIWTTDGLLTDEIAREEIAFYFDVDSIEVEPSDEAVENAYWTELISDVLEGLD